jgi:hypothetical protein
MTVSLVIRRDAYDLTTMPGERMSDNTLHGLAKTKEITHHEEDNC